MTYANGAAHHARGRYTLGTVARCVACGGRARDLGRLPDSDRFAGRRLHRPLPGGRLYRCEHCGLGFRWPRPDQASLDALYRAGEPLHWNDAVESRADWRYAAEWIGAHVPEGGTVLDVGCFDGRFVATLRGDIRRCGIELMPEAARRAERAGVDIVARDFGDLRRHRRTFDAITAFDVIEHVPDPLAFLDAAACALAPGGALLVGTGDLDAWTWRVMRNRYWYCAIPEHVSFASARWFRHAAAALGLEIATSRRYAHAPSGRRAAREALANLVFLAAPRLFAWARRLRNPEWRAVPIASGCAIMPPAWQSARDHLLIVLRPAS